jgi:NodT family efflux transporter outer membrane factor (OMF) lipoprotein
MAGGDPVSTVAASGAAQAFSRGAKIEADWWTLFRSPQVDAVIRLAIGDNPGLQAAQANLRQSHDLLRSGYGIFYPSVGANFDATRQNYSPEKIGGRGPGSIFNLFTLSATVSYALDIFGGERRTIEGMAAEADLQRDTELGVELTLSANIVNALIAKAAYRAEIDATRQLIDLEKRQVGLAEVQARAGTAPYSSVLSLRSQLAATEASIPQLEQKLSQTDDLLATLVGRTPAEWTPPAISFSDLALPAKLPVSLPSELVSQRPDILAAEATAHAASANIGVATAAMLPAVTLSGTYGANNSAASQLFAAGSKFWSFGADVATPVFEGGTLWFKRKAAVDSYQAAIAGYRQTVIGAFAQVADTLRALEHDAATLAADDDALSAAAEALRLVQANYAAGLANYTDVLIADGQFHQAQISDLQARAVRYQDTVALFAALGGGWWNASNLPPERTAFR